MTLGDRAATRLGGLIPDDLVLATVGGDRGPITVFGCGPAAGSGHVGGSITPASGVVVMSVGDGSAVTRSTDRTPDSGATRPTGAEWSTHPRSQRVIHVLDKWMNYILCTNTLNEVTKWVCLIQKATNPPRRCFRKNAHELASAIDGDSGVERGR